MNSTPLRQARDQQELTQEALAKKVGIGIRSYVRYEQGERIPPYSTMKALAKALNSSVQELFDA